MECEIASLLFKSYLRTAREFSEAASRLNGPIGKPAEFVMEKAKVVVLCEECRAARRLWEDHCTEHLCRRR